MQRVDDAREVALVGDEAHELVAARTHVDELAEQTEAEHGGDAVAVARVRADELEQRCRVVAQHAHHCHLLAPLLHI